MDFFIWLGKENLFHLLSQERREKNLSSEAVEGAALALEGVDDVHGGDGLPAGVLGVGHGVTDDGLKENLEHTAGLLVDETGDALNTTTASQAADRGLGDALDVVAQHLAVPLGAALAETLATLTTTRPCRLLSVLMLVSLSSLLFAPIFLVTFVKIGLRQFFIFLKKGKKKKTTEKSTILHINPMRMECSAHKKMYPSLARDVLTINTEHGTYVV